LCKKSFAATAAQYSSERGCVKRFFTALRAELCFERHVIFTISRSAIVKMSCLSEEYSAAAGGKRLFTQPRSKHNSARSAEKATYGAKVVE
jgi:hypothetical protein